MLSQNQIRQYDEIVNIIWYQILQIWCQIQIVYKTNIYNIKNRSQIVMNSIVGSQSQSKRDQFRKQIRRKQIQQIFVIKRKLISQSPTQYHKDEQQDLQNLYQQIKTKQDLDDKLTALGNYLWLENSLLNTKNRHGIQKVQQLCLGIVNTVFVCVLPSLRLDTEENQGTRKKCLTIVSNIMADPLAPHGLLLSVIAEGLNNNYSSLSEINAEEASEIGWIIANSVCHKLDLSLQSDLQKPIQQILTLSQQAILIPNLQMTQIIYKNLTVFFKNTDNFYSPTHTLIQHFKVHRLILLENSVNYNLNIQLGTKVIPVLDFIEYNIKYTKCISQKFNQQICQKCFSILSVTSSDKIMMACFRVVQMLVIDREVVVGVVATHFQVLSKCLMFYGANIKISAARLIWHMCIDKEITTFMAENKQVQAILVELLKTVRDSDTLIQLMILTRAIASMTDRKCGMKAVSVIQERLLLKNGQVGKYAAQIIAQFGVEQQNSRNNYL